MKKENFLTCLVIFLIVSIFIFLGFFKNSNETKIIYNTKESSLNDIEGNSSKNKGSSSSSKKKNSNSSSSKTQNNKNDKNDKDDKNSSTTISFEEDMFESENNESTESSKDSSEDNNQTSSDTDNSNDETNISYQDLMNRIQSLENYGISVSFNWCENIVDSNYGYISDISEAEEMVGFLENMVYSIPSNYFFNLQNLGYTTKFILIDDSSGNSIDYYMQGNSIIYKIKNNYNLSVSNFLNNAYDINSEIIGKNKMNVLYYQINRFNPAGFVYGTLNNELVNSGYFLNIQSQKSVQDDCKNIFIKYYSNQLSANDYAGLVLYDKINTIVNFFDGEVFY